MSLPDPSHSDRGDQQPIFWEDKRGNSFSAYPPTTYLTFAYWIFCVPQYKPTSVLILGYGAGTIAGLIKLLYGNVQITGVDSLPMEDRYGCTLIQADAEEYVKTCGEFDTVIVDLFDMEGEFKAAPFVEQESFVSDLERIANYLIINTLHTDMSAYRHLRKMGHNKASGCAEVINYYQVKEAIPNLHPYR